MQSNLRRFFKLFFFRRQQKVVVISPSFPVIRSMIRIGFVFNFIQIYSDFVLNRFAMLTHVWVCAIRLWIKINKTVSWPIVIIIIISFLLTKSSVQTAFSFRYFSSKSSWKLWSPIIRCVCVCIYRLELGTRILHVAYKMKHFIHLLRHCTRNLLILIKEENYKNLFDDILSVFMCCVRGTIAICA